MKKIVLAAMLLCGVLNVYAEDLAQVYRDAVKFDPEFQQARATYLSTAQELPKTLSFLLPNISATATSSDSHVDGTTIIRSKIHNNSLALNVSQILVDFSLWSGAERAGSLKKQAYATYVAAAQDLIVRTARTYFDVLEAQDILRFNIAQKKAFKKQLDQANERHKVGLDPITNVYDAQARYDATVASVIAAKNAVDNALETLQTITGVHYAYLTPMRKFTPLVKPYPQQASSWEHAARKHNMDVIAAQHALRAARAQVRVQQSGHLPVLQAVGSVSRTYSGSATAFAPNLARRQTSYGVQLDLPIFAGGNVIASTRQAKFDFQAQLAGLEAAHRAAVNNTRQSFNNIVAGISKIRADRRALKSNRSSVESNEEAFKVGTRTIVDVLIAQQNLTNAQQTHAQDQYKLIDDTLELKRAVGSVNVNDILAFNAWLDHSGGYGRKAPHGYKPQQLHNRGSVHYHSHPPVGKHAGFKLDARTMKTGSHKHVAKKHVVKRNVNVKKAVAKQHVVKKHVASERVAKRRVAKKAAGHKRAA